MIIKWKKIFNFECDVFLHIYNIVIRDLTEGKILISENSTFSIYLKKEENNKLEFIQEINFDNDRNFNIPMDGITHKYFFIEEDLKEITIFEKKQICWIKKKNFIVKRKKLKEIIKL